jgi:hypothetical protein
MNATPAPTAPPVAAKPANNDTALELGGGALAILALGAGALALSRRRRHEDEEVWEDEYVEPTAAEPVVTPRHDPVAKHEPPMIAPEPSAFGWGASQAREEHIAGSGGDRRPGETWVERAYRGPTADNPSLSLRKRLKRAAFFDKREREAAEGRAAPVESDAGLPENVTDNRELEAA